MIRIYICFVIIIICLQPEIHAQQDKYRWNVGIHLGVTPYDGDLSHKGFLDYRDYFKDGFIQSGEVPHGVGLSVEYAMSQAWSVRTLMYYGELKGDDRAQDKDGNDIRSAKYFKRGLNFTSDLFDGSIAFIYHFDHDKFFGKRAIVAPYLGLGASLYAADISFDSQFEKNGNRFIYQQDQDGNLFILENGVKVEVERDGQLDYGPITTNNGSVLGIVGVKFRISDRLNLNLETQVHYALSDRIDNAYGDFPMRDEWPNNYSIVNPFDFQGPRGSSGRFKNDLYAYVNASFHFNFGYKTQNFTAPPIYYRDMQLDRIAPLGDRSMSSVSSKGEKAKEEIKVKAIEVDQSSSEVQQVDEMKKNVIPQKNLPNKFEIQTKGDTIIVYSIPDSAAVDGQVNLGEVNENPFIYEDTTAIEEKVSTDSSLNVANDNMNMNMATDSMQVNRAMTDSMEQKRESIDTIIDKKVMIDSISKDVKDTIASNKTVTDTFEMEVKKSINDSIEQKKMIVDTIQKAKGYTTPSELGNSVNDTTGTVINNKVKIDSSINVAASIDQVVADKKQPDTVYVENTVRDTVIMEKNIQLPLMAQNAVGARDSIIELQSQLQSNNATMKQLEVSIDSLKMMNDVLLKQQKMLSSESVEDSIAFANAIEYVNEQERQKYQDRIETLEKQLMKQENVPVKPDSIVENVQSNLIPKTETRTTTDNQQSSKALENRDEIARLQARLNAQNIEIKTLREQLNEEKKVNISSPSFSIDNKATLRNRDNAKKNEDSLNISPSIDAPKATIDTNSNRELQKLMKQYDEDNKERISVLLDRIDELESALANREPAKETVVVKTEKVPETKYVEREKTMTDRINEVSPINIFFDTGKSQYSSNFEAQLIKIKNLLSKYPELNLSLVGHTDKSGSIQANMLLAKKRAESIVIFFAKNGIDKTRMKVIAVGPTESAGVNDAFARRVEVIVTN